MPRLKPHENLVIASMGKLFRVTAIFTHDDDANNYMRSHKGEGVIATFANVVFIAELYGSLGPYKLKREEE